MSAYPDPPLDPAYVPDIDAFPLATLACVSQVLPLMNRPEHTARALIIVPPGDRGYCLSRKIKDAIMGAVFMAVECRVVDGPSGRMLQYGGGGRDTHQLPLTPHPCLAGTLAPFLSTSVHCRHHCRCHSVYSSNHHYAPPPPPPHTLPASPSPCVFPQPGGTIPPSA